MQAAQSIEAGSKSFAAAARLFDERTRHSAFMLYAWCRYCDDVIDGQVLGHARGTRERGDAAERLEHLRALTRRAYRGETMTEAPFAAFQEVVRRHTLPEHLPAQHLAGFAMDVAGRRYLTMDDTLDYCYHVAGVVGVMMAKIMAIRDEAVLDRAADLGIALQLTNIARDVVEDAEFGRVYLPQDWLAAEAIPPLDVALPAHRVGLARVASRVLDVADDYYDSAVHGIAALPLRSAWAIATARAVYRRIGRRVLARGARAWDTRTTTSRADKLRQIVFGGAGAMYSRFTQPRSRPLNLWRRPAEHRGAVRAQS
jgi:15-cis-phytoene synthase